MEISFLSLISLGEKQGCELHVLNHNAGTSPSQLEVSPPPKPSCRVSDTCLYWNNLYRLPFSLFKADYEVFLHNILCILWSILVVFLSRALILSCSWIIPTQICSVLHRAMIAIARHCSKQMITLYLHFRMWFEAKGCFFWKIPHLPPLWSFSSTKLTPLQTEHF